MVEDMHRLVVRGRLGPCHLNHIKEAWHLGPKVLEPEGGRAPRATLAQEHERAVVEERRGEGGKHMITKSKFPARIAESLSSLTKVGSFLSLLQVNLRFCSLTSLR